METHGRIGCGRVRDERLDRRYLAGEMADAEATAFEEHYLACDECWLLVQRGAATPVARAPTSAASAPSAPSAPSSRWVWITAAMIALAVLLRLAA